MTERALLRQPPSMQLDVAPLRRRIDAAIVRGGLRWWRHPRWRWTAAAILALETNAIVQLVRSTGEGVDVLTGNQRLARGEIIMIEDRTGIRINEITEKESR